MGPARAAEAIVRSVHKSSDDSGCGHDQTERFAPHKICEYLACSPGMNVLVVECSGGNSRPSCPSGVGGGTLRNRKTSSSVAGQSQTSAGIVRRCLRPARKFLSRQRRHPQVRHRGRTYRPCSTCAIYLNRRCFRMSWWECTRLKGVDRQSVNGWKCPDLLVLQIGFTPLDSIAPVLPYKKHSRGSEEMLDGD